MTDAWEMHQAETGLNPGPVWRDRGIIIANLTRDKQALEERVAELELAALNLRDNTQGAHEALGKAQAEVGRLAGWVTFWCDKVRAVESLADEWDHEDRTNGPVGDRVQELRAALAASPAVDTKPEPTPADECTCRGMDEKPGCNHGFPTPAAEPQAEVPDLLGALQASLVKARESRRPAAEPQAEGGA